MLKLYSYWRSSCSYRVRIALNHKGLAYEHAGVSLPRGEHLETKYKAVNAQGLAGKLLNGWGLSGIVTWNSGFPFLPSSSTQFSRSLVAGANGGQKRPNVIAGADVDKITRGGSLGHVEKPEAARARFLRIDGRRLYPDAVVLDAQDDFRIGLAKLDHDPRCLRVLLDVGERLLNDAIQVQLDRHRQARFRQLR